MNLEVFLTGRGEFLKKLIINNLTLTNDSKVPLTDKTNPTFDFVVNDTLGNLSGLVGLALKNNKYLETISLVDNMEDLRQIDLRGTGVVDLNPLAENCSNLWSVILDNPEIVVANDVDELTRKADITSVERLFNNTYSQAIPREVNDYLIYGNTFGVVLTDESLINQLSKSTNIEYFRCSYYALGRVLGDSEICFDLSNTKLKSFDYMWNCTENGEKFVFPSSLEYVRFSNCNKTSKGDLAYYFDDVNLSLLNKLETCVGNNCNWDTFWNFASSLPRAIEIDYYNSSIGSDNSLESYSEGLKKIRSLTSLNIYSYIGNLSKNTVGYNQLRYISELESLEKVHFGYMGKLVDVSFLNNLTNLKSVTLSYTGVHSLDFIRNLDELTELVINNTAVGETDFDKNNQVINNLDLIKEAFNKKLKTIDIRNTYITAENIGSSGLRNLNWTSFKY